MPDKNKHFMLVEDDPGVREQLQWYFEDYDVITAEDMKSAVSQFRKHDPHVVVLDLGLPPDPEGVDEGFRTLGELLHLNPHAKVIVITGNADQGSAVRAVGQGAYDFYNKPIDVDTLELVIQRAFCIYELEEQNRSLLELQHGNTQFAGIIGVSEPMLRVCRLVEKVAPTTATVLLVGESGTGKELFARAIHSQSSRSGAPFVAINCAAIPENLLESELFGYRKGAFTGAVRDSTGKIEGAEGGTLFLDEIGDMSIQLQAKLLRFLQERRISRLGSTEEVDVDVRVICATNRDLDELMQQKLFREDLYYRINELTIEIPPLRDRDADAVVLARAFLKKYAEENGRAVGGFTDDAVRSIENYSWPGNVRELENKVKTAVILSDSRRISARDIGLEDADESTLLNLRALREQVERRAIQKAISLSNGNVSRAAEMLGVTRPTLYALLQKYHMSASAGGQL